MKDCCKSCVNAGMPEPHRGFNPTSQDTPLTLLKYKTIEPDPPEALHMQLQAMLVRPGSLSPSLHHSDFAILVCINLIHAWAGSRKVVRQFKLRTSYHVGHFGFGAGSAVTGQRFKVITPLWSAAISLSFQYLPGSTTHIRLATV